MRAPSCAEPDSYPASGFCIVEYVLGKAWDYPVTPESYATLLADSRTGKADEMLRTDVRGKERGTDGYPRCIAPTEEIIGRVIILLTKHPEYNSYQCTTKPTDNDPV
jgi:hypothetical protein